MFFVFGGNGSGGGSPLTTKGDIYVYSTANTRLPVGTDGQVLLADSSQATGLRWGAAPASGAGGSNTQLQYNNAGSLAGITRATSNGTSVTFLANGITLVDQTDNTKVAAFDASAITTATTRTYTLPNVLS